MEAEQSAPDLSIVIATLDTRDLLAACLDSIRAAGEGLRIETIVVDNASGDGTAAMLAERYPEVRVIRNEANRGFAEANNQGIEASGGRHVMLLNSDTEVRPGALSTLVRYLDEHPEVGACGPRLRFPDGSVQQSVFSFDSPLRHMMDMLAIGRVFRGTRLENLNTRFGYDRTGAVDWMIAAAFVVRRRVVEEVGLLDPRFRLHCNDLDWCYRIRRAGHPIAFVAEAEVVHHSGATLRSERRKRDVDGELLRNLFDYHRKHFGRLGLAWFRFWMVIGYAARAAAGRLGVGSGNRFRVAPDSAARAERRILAALTGRFG